MKVKKSKGFALIYTLLLSSVILLFISFSVKLVIASLQDTKRNFMKSNQAINVAKAGAQEAYFWFSRQSTQPVRQTGELHKDQAFNPRYHENPDNRDTDDETVGLVKDFDFGTIATSNNPLKLFGHFEVKRYDPEKDTSFNNKAVKDISHLRTDEEEGSGYIWQIVSEGSIYIRKDFQLKQDGTYQKKYNESPNQVLDSATVSVDIQRITLWNPNAAVTLNRGTDLTMNSRGRINGGSQFGVRYRTNAPSNQTNISPDTRKVTSDPDLNLSVEKVFGVNENTLKGLVDNVAESMEDLKNIGSMSITYAKLNNVIFTNQIPLKGGGILFVDGNLTLEESSNSYFSGIIYVKNGNVTIKGNNIVSGAIILATADKTIKIEADNDTADVEYSDGIITTIINKLARYRLNRLSYRTMQN